MIKANILKMAVLKRAHFYGIILYTKIFTKIHKNVLQK